MDWATNEKHYTAFKLMEANDKIVTMPNGNRIFDIREFNRIRKNLGINEKVNLLLFF